jgi:hypothetical protein
MATNWVLSRKRYSLASTAEQVLDLFLNGIGDTGPRERSKRTN